MYKFKVNDVVTVFEDVMTQHIYEGAGKIVKIHKQDNEVVDCDVWFTEDKYGKNIKADKEIVRRQIKVPVCKRRDVNIKELLA